MTIVVAGDLTMDWNLVNTEPPRDNIPAPDWWWNKDCIRFSWQRGGAGLLADLIEQVAQDPELAQQHKYHIAKVNAPPEAVNPDKTAYHHSVHLWSQQPRSDDDKTPVWRLQEALGMQQANPKNPDAIKWQKVANEPATADLVVLDDSNLGFRKNAPLWPKALAAAPSPWVLVKMASPVARGDLWDRLIATCAEKLIVVMSANDLRRSEVQVSRALSWERTAQDLYWELTNNPLAKKLANCAHVLVSFDRAGVLLLSRAKEGAGHTCTLFFDPANPGESAAWERTTMIGYRSCLVASVARQIMRNPADPDLEAAIQGGVTAMRLLHAGGYEQRGRDQELRVYFPIRSVIKAIASKKKPKKKLLPCAAVPAPPRSRNDGAAPAGAQPGEPFWTILQDRYPEGLDEAAKCIVVHGVECLHPGVPLGRFARLLTVDRWEIESYRSIRAVLEEYCNQPKQQPLSIAVFGPPGAGKSFGLVQVATSVMPRTAEVRTFNLSQFSDPSDLVGALHQVRDIALSGKVPLVFWDEFDTRCGDEELGWLHYFLAPMQEGSFQDGQVTHHLGRCIFVFAGGTCASVDEFTAKVAGKRLKAAKGIDFLSRLKGYIDILGPNPHDVMYPAGDPHALVRRAVLLRSHLRRAAPRLFSQPGSEGELSIDEGVLQAFLMTRRYKHGARSMEAIIAMSSLLERSHFERSCLPSQAQLGLHVDGLEFLALVQQPAPKPAAWAKMAKAAHEAHRSRRSGDLRAPSADVAYADLADDEKAECHAWVRSLPLLLSGRGYIMAAAGKARKHAQFTFPETDVEALAEVEHERALRARVDAGWRYAPGRADVRSHTRPDILPWHALSKAQRAQISPAVAAAMGAEPLPDTEKEHVRDRIRSIPAIVAAAGYAIVRLRTERKNGR